MLHWVLKCIKWYICTAYVYNSAWPLILLEMIAYYSTCYRTVKYEKYNQENIL